MDDKLRVGVYTNTHGVHGEIKVWPTTDDISRFHKGLPLFLDVPGKQIPLVVERVKTFKKKVLCFREKSCRIAENTYAKD